MNFFSMLLTSRESSRAPSILRSQLSSGTRPILSKAAFASSSVPKTPVPKSQVPPHSKTHPDLDESTKISVQVYDYKVAEMDQYSVFESAIAISEPVLTAKLEEIGSLDTAANADPNNRFGKTRKVVIRQKNINLPVLVKNWIIIFQDDESLAKWSSIWG